MQKLVLKFLSKLTPKEWDNSIKIIENECCRRHREISEMTDEELNAELERLENKIINKNSNY